MKVKELIDLLSKYDQELTVIYSTQEDNYEPCPVLNKYDFNSAYYTGIKFVTLPKNTEFVSL